MPPQALVWLLVFTACLSFAIGIGFAWVGAWPVLPFIGLEVAALATAFFAQARRAADYERIEVRDGEMRVEVRDAGRDVVARRVEGADRTHARAGRVVAVKARPREPVWHRGRGVLH